MAFASDGRLLASRSPDGRVWLREAPGGRLLANSQCHLLSNAIKYSPAGGEVTVTLERQEDQDGSWTLVRVRDCGVDIPAADQAHVFDHFHRAGNVAGRIASTGLGLAGSCRIVQQPGGTLEVESEEGRGSTFTVRLPLSAGGTSQGNARFRHSPLSARG